MDKTGAETMSAHDAADPFELAEQEITNLHDRIAHLEAELVEARREREEAIQRSARAHQTLEEVETENDKLEAKIVDLRWQVGEREVAIEGDGMCHHQHPLKPPGVVMFSHPMAEPCLLRESALRTQLATVEGERDGMKRLLSIQGEQAEGVERDLHEANVENARLQASLTTAEAEKAGMRLAIEAEMAARSLNSRIPAGHETQEAYKRAYNLMVQALSTPSPFLEAVQGAIRVLERFAEGHYSMSLAASALAPLRALGLASPHLRGIEKG